MHRWLTWRNYSNVHPNQKNSVLVLVYQCNACASVPMTIKTSRYVSTRLSYIFISMLDASSGSMSNEVIRSLRSCHWIHSVWHTVPKRVASLVWGARGRSFWRLMRHCSTFVVLRYSSKQCWLTIYLHGNLMGIHSGIASPSLPSSSLCSKYLRRHIQPSGAMSLAGEAGVNC